MDSLDDNESARASLFVGASAMLDVGIEPASSRRPGSDRPGVSLSNRGFRECIIFVKIRALSTLRAYLLRHLKKLIFEAYI